MHPYDLIPGINLYSVCLLVGVLFALFFADRAIVKKNFSLPLQRLVLIGGFSAVILGCGSAALFQSFYDFLATGQFVLGSGMTFFGGLIGGVVVFLLVWFPIGSKTCPDHDEPKKRFPDMLDIAAACVPVAHGFGRLGCLFAGCCHGAETEAWYGIRMLVESDGGKVWKTVVPTQLYEAIFLFLLGAVLIWLLVSRSGKRRLPLMSLYAFFYGVWRFVIEYFRADDRGGSIVSFLSPSQLTAVFLILFGIGYFALWLWKRGADKRARRSQAKKRFETLFEKPAERVYSASGRINLIGEHIDYCGGKVFPAAIHLNCDVYAAKNGRDELRLAFRGKEEIVTLSLSQLETYKTLPLGNYQAGVAYLLQQSGVDLVGCDLYYDCSVPFGGGLSSSAAIEGSTAAALLGTAGLPYDKKEIALLCRRAENEYVGMNCGVMDQFISALGKKGCAMLLDCDTLQHRHVPLRLRDCELVVANCNKPHNLVESKYNERRAQADEALRLVQTKKQVSALAELTPADVEDCRDVLPDVLYRRALHVASEQERVQEAVCALERGDTVALGELLNASHGSLKDLYEVTGRELDALADAFRTQKGCLGARMIGGGFGGCVLALVKSKCAEECIKKAGKTYEEQVGYAATFYPVRISDGLTERKP